MDRNAQGRKPLAGAQPTTKSQAQFPRDKRTQRERLQRAPGRIKEAKDSSEIIRVPKRVQAISADRPSTDRPSTDDDPNARHFTVANVGRNGTLYLKPSRLQAPSPQVPATPPRTADGQSELPLDAFARRPSAMSGTWTPRVSAPRGNAMNTTVPVPPLSIANGHDRRRTRSHSFSTIGSVRAPTYDQTDYQILLNGKDTATGRPKSSVDLSEAMLDLRIPHYRLGTPRFSERGTAYLHNSVYTSTSDLRSSVFSRADYDKLFPAPPGREQGEVGGSSPVYLHPSRATLTPSRTPPTPHTASPEVVISPFIFDRVEARINDATIVRYSPSTGRIIAATPARLIAQITSPLFLDYELLADFFLTFRTFLSCSDLVEYMLARMQWALTNDSDAGRIVRVRTFVALRHWILNYFADDFIPATCLRQRFCDSVNLLTRSLLRGIDRGGTDMNVIGELKKCWRRTCAKYWPVPNALDSSAEADILPGPEVSIPGMENSSTSLPLTGPHRSSQMDFRRSSVIRLPADFENGSLGVLPPADLHEEIPRHVRTASIPASPMSEDSLTVLSCSVPFLRHMMPGRDRPPRPPAPRRSPGLDGSHRPSQAHKRSGSFTDALHDRRPPLPSLSLDHVDMRALNTLTFTGGLVRGLLLQPSPSKVELLVPLSPPIERQMYISPDNSEESLQNEQYQSVGMRRLVGDVRRVLSNRKGTHESPASSHRSTNSSDSRSSGNLQPANRDSSGGGHGGWQQLGGPPRIDMLAEKIETSYQEAFHQQPDTTEDQPGSEQGAVRETMFSNGRDEHSDPFPVEKMRRLDSHVTTGSRSIVIFDDTGSIPELPKSFGGLQSARSWSNGVAPAEQYRTSRPDLADLRRSKSEATAVASESHTSPGEVHMHELLSASESWVAFGAKETGFTPARKSSSAHPSAFELQPIRNQLRRRPGGDDLKTAENVHDLEPAPRHHHGDSYSTITQSFSSDMPPHDLHGTHFSGQGYQGWKIADSLGHYGGEDMSLLPTTGANVRPSFQREVSHLKRVPTEEQQGGVEDALAKLEGKPSTLNLNSSKASAQREDSGVPSMLNQGPRSSSVQFARVAAPGNDSDSIDTAGLYSPTTNRQGASIYRMSDSEDGDAHVGEQSRLRPTNPDPSTTGTSDSCAIESVDFADFQRQTRLDDASASEQLNKASPRIGTPQGSFLLDDNESLSDISTEIADQSGDESLGVRSFFFDDTPADEVQMPAFRPPPTPPSTVGQTASMSETRTSAPYPSVAEKKTLKEVASAPKLLPSSRKENTFEQRPSELRRVPTSPSHKQLAHLPFVLAFESDVIAEQMTIIEKDALDEVEWKDLVGLNWLQNPCPIRNWVDFLKSESNGIDVVIARFNLVVKWIVSECLLTEAPSERARCVTKYIHIASHCHRLRNYASMYQIVLALLSTDMARLHQTWSLVAPSEKAMLDRLEKLCQPLRNFHNLRSEMELASESEGCIPFIGLYTHDLMFNAQKPALIDPLPPGKEKLVNFERHQTAATIVKSLLRLIEASSKYIFRPHPEVLSRCLWLAALDDAEITTRSKTLEL